MQSLCAVAHWQVEVLVRILFWVAPGCWWTVSYAIILNIFSVFKEATAVMIGFISPVKSYYGVSFRFVVSMKLFTCCFVLEVLESLQ